jgi:phosphatidylserine/phosphatidylglycerophosphate/cardiolipin synthase-like enzyme
MRPQSILLIAFTAIGFLSRSPGQTTLAKWTFETLPFGSTSGYTGSTLTIPGGSVAADSGVFAASSAVSGFHVSSSTVWSAPAGNGSQKSLSSNNWAVGDYYQFRLSTVGYRGITITWDQTGSSTGPRDFKIQYSTDGSTFFDDSSYSVPAPNNTAITWSSGTRNPASTLTVNLSGVTSLDNKSSIYIRLVNRGTTSINGGTVGTAGTNRIDNFTVTATPISGAPVRGIGTAAVSPTVLKADTGLTLTVTVRGDAAGTISNIVMIVPTIFSWSRTRDDVTVERGGTPAVAIRQDSLILTNVNLPANDSVRVQVRRLSAPDTTAYVDVRIETAAGSDTTAALAQLPRLLLYGKPRPIFDVRANNSSGIPLMLGKPVTVRGIVTVGRQFNNPAYMQDVSGGIAIFDNAFVSTRQTGDEVTLTGTITQFNGLTELEQVTVHQVHSTGNSVTPLVVTASQLRRDTVGAVEQYEGMLVEIRRVRVLDQSNQPVSTWASNVNYKLIDATDTVAVRIDGDTDLPGASAPQGEFDIIGVVGQFVNTAPYIGGYQILPRSRSDLLTRGPLIVVDPLESSITPTSLVLSWQTQNPGTSHVRYGRTASYELGVRSGTGQTTAHAVVLDNLRPATMYTVQAFSVSGTDTSFAAPRVVSTASQGSTGQINVYFNKSIDASLARYGTANAQTNLVQKLLDRINAATVSIDCAVYSLSGTVGQAIANALIAAKNRGVSVRMIVEKDNLTTGTGQIFNQTLGQAIPWIADDYDAANAGVGLHHNKFFVFDSRGGAPDKIWIWTGSWNPTDPGTENDMQNVIEIQDQALAGAFTAEFNEMWGSDTDTPNAAQSRFGPRKTDNTPHIFNIGGVQVECYFSPSDRATSKIISTLNKAQHSINIAMLTLTRSDIAGVLKAKNDAGVRVRGVLDNGTDSGSQYTFFQQNGMDFRLDPNPTALLHHKYAVIDAEQASGSTAHYVITGSHNWTSTAENSNNENTLIIFDNRIANHYLQEFSARYQEAGGSPIVVKVEDAASAVPGMFWLGQNFPNPFNPSTEISFSVGSREVVSLRVYDLLGREIATLVNEELPAGVYRVRWEAKNVAGGVYYYRLRAGNYHEVKKMVLVR